MDPRGAEPHVSSGAASVTGVEDEVEEHLLKLVGVGRERWQVLGHFDVKLDAPALRFDVHQLP